MDFFQAIALGIIEGVTEFLPISSTGHLILAGKLLNIPDSNFLRTFDIAIQSGAILSVVVLYGAKLIRDRQLFKKVFVAFIPTGVLGFMLYKLVKNYLLDNEIVVLFSLLSGGILLIVFEKLFKQTNKHHDLENLTYKQSLLIGTIQSVSMIPGVSRAAATILGGLFLGLRRQAAVEFSFLLAIPTMLVATSYDLIKSAGSFSSNDFGVLMVGFVTSFVVALVVIRWFLNFIRQYDFVPFGVYRIIVALVFFLLLI